MDLKTFRGRRVYDINGYPAVTWPDHPTAKGLGGYVYVHRAVAYELWGDAVFTLVVHHKDGDKWNWSTDNLELLTPSAHGRHHSPNSSVEVLCEHCGGSYDVVPSRVEKTRYCNTRCRGLADRKIDWPIPGQVKRLVQEHGLEGTGRLLGVSGSSVKKYLARYSGV